MTLSFYTTKFGIIFEVYSVLATAFVKTFIFVTNSTALTELYKVDVQ